MMINLNQIVIIFSVICCVKPYSLKITLPDVHPTSSDEYICSTFPVPPRNRESYIVSYEPLVNRSVAHHMLLFGCAVPYSTESSYPCGNICDGQQEKIIFVWAKEAKKFDYPTNSGMMIGGSSNINYLILQVHYLSPTQQKDHSGLLLTLTEEPPKYLVGIMLLFSYYGVIEPKDPKAHLEISCKFKGNMEAYALGFRTHAHTLARSSSGFRVSEAEGQIDLIGKANPQWPQTFYKSNPIIIKPGDILMARCVYDSRGRDTVTHIGSTHHDEMCNFYIMLMTRNTGEMNNFLSCGGNEFKELWKNIPSYSMEYDAENPSPDLQLTKTSIKEYASMSAVVKWKVKARLGEVSSVAILHKSSELKNYTLLVFHRGSHKWTQNSFRNNVYQDVSYPISDSTILEIDPSTGKVLREAGQNLFYLPHGITVTKDGKYIWITDVALHQVMRFNVREDSKLIDTSPSIILGEKFVPDNDKNHFCKPAKVAVDSQGNIFVADGYCNSRIVCFSPNGTYIEEWRSKDFMSIVHAITIEEDQSGDISKNVVWVADRENRRIIGFNYDGSIKFGRSSSIPLQVYGIEYNPSDRLIYGVTSNGYNTGGSFIFNTSTYSIEKSWNGQFSLQVPHDFCLAENGKTIFVAELHLKRVVKFDLDGTSISKPNLVIQKFNHFNLLMRNNYLALIGTSLIIAIFVIVICVIGMRYYRYFLSRNGKIRRYGRVYNDKEGFRPLTQHDDENDDGNSDPEADEYSTPIGHPLRKPKV